VSLARGLGAWLARRAFVARAIEERADLSAFRGKISLRYGLGLFLIAFSFVLGGWPTIALLGVIAVWLREPLVIAIGGPLFYGGSWAIWGVGMLLAGKQGVEHGRAFLRWLARALTLRLLGRRPDG
jgi:hypothetical protein